QCPSPAPWHRAGERPGPHRPPTRLRRCATPSSTSFASDLVSGHDDETLQEGCRVPGETCCTSTGDRRQEGGTSGVGDDAGEGWDDGAPADPLGEPTETPPLCSCS